MRQTLADLWIRVASLRQLAGDHTGARRARTNAHILRRAETLEAFLERDQRRAGRCDDCRECCEERCEFCVACCG